MMCAKKLRIRTSFLSTSPGSSCVGWKKADEAKHLVELFLPSFLNQINAPPEFVYMFNSLSFLSRTLGGVDVISRSDLPVLRQQWVDLCLAIEARLGPENVPANCHMGFHIYDCFLAHGPASGHWLFSFERLNRIVGSKYTSGKKRTVCNELLQKRVERSYFCALLDSWIMQSAHRPATRAAHNDSLLALKHDIITEGNSSFKTTFSHLKSSDAYHLRINLAQFGSLDTFDKFIDRV